MDEIYISTDVETNGPCPGIYSMLSLGSAAFDGKSETPINTFYVNLELIPTAGVDKSTSDFWKDNKEAYAKTRTDLQTPYKAMFGYVRWLKGLKARPIFVGYPAAFDSLFVFWYLWTYAGDNPFGWHALDIKSYAMAHLGFVSYSSAVKRMFPPGWFGDAPHTHHALDDAIEQGILFTRIYKEVQEHHHAGTTIS